MVLLIGVVAGLAAGLVRARLERRPYIIPEIRWLWLVFVAFLPQFVAFVIPTTRVLVPDEWIPFVLLFSQGLLLVWVAANLRFRGIQVMGLGLLLNFIVIAANGGMMPIRPEMVTRLYPDAPPGAWQIGSRLGVGKDVVLRVEDTNFWFLSDWFTLPDWIPYSVAFSIGDVFIALGVFWLLFSFPSKGPAQLEVDHEQKGE